jgi:hypothetical protein
MVPISGAQGEHMIVVANGPKVHNLIVCTSCSCYPWAVLGLPPVWYKAAPYRSRAVIDPRRCRTLGRGISSSTENITIRAHRALRASFSLPSFLPIAYGAFRSPTCPRADTPTRRHRAMQSVVNRSQVFGFRRPAPIDSAEPAGRPRC